MLYHLFVNIINYLRIVLALEMYNQCMKHSLTKWFISCLKFDIQKLIGSF